MDKKEVQQRVLQDGKPLSLDKFAWDEDTRTFSSNEDNLVLDFSIELNKVNMPIKLNGGNEKGYTELKPKHTITIDGKEIELSEECFNSLKEQLED